MRPDTDVLIAGAGPTGLVLALWLTRLGVPVRIVDKNEQPGTTSRALAVQARTLEFYHQIGIAGQVVEDGWKTLAANFWVAGRKRARAVLGAMGEGLTPYPYALIYPQDEHERLLIDRLSEAGVQVERRVELIGFEESAAAVTARLKPQEGVEETCTAAFIAGCDGAHSSARQALGIGFPGGTYEHLFYVADVQASGPPMDGELHVALDRSDFLAVFPLKGRGRARLIGTIRADAEGGANLTWDDVGKWVIDWTQIEVERVNWFSTYRVHHRVADRFRKGRTFLLGDAAHIHSPVGGQGMNTGIGDAVNLAWKLAAVLQGRAHASLLDTYEPERIAFARRLVATTDRAFTGVISSGAWARFVRLRLVPLLVPLLVRTQRGRRLIFRTVSQTGVNYRGSSLSEGGAGSVQAGDRLPWVQTESGDNFDSLSLLDWQVHVYGEVAAGVRGLCQQRGLSLGVFSWERNAQRAGLGRGAAYLIRPDGYIATSGGADSIASYLDSRGIIPIGRL